MSPSAPFPDFFVVGFPRCGTTSLCAYLAAHPAICFSKPKEPHYFSKLGGGGGGDLQRDYLDRCFAHRRPEHRIAGEGSVSTIYSPEAIERILSLQPRARFIAMVRNPIDMLLSYHLRLLFLLEEDEEDLAVAWSLQEARARGERLPRLCTEPRLLQYAEAGSHGTWLERLFAAAGEQQCLTVVYDDFSADPSRPTSACCASSSWSRRVSFRSSGASSEAAATARACSSSSSSSLRVRSRASQGCGPPRRPCPWHDPTTSSARRNARRGERWRA